MPSSESLRDIDHGYDVLYGRDLRGKRLVQVRSHAVYMVFENRAAIDILIEKLNEAWEAMDALDEVKGQTVIEQIK